MTIRPPGGNFATISFSMGVVPANKSLGGVWVNWLVNPISPRSSATKAAASADHGTRPSRGRTHTSNAPPTQNASAMTVASRTVSVRTGRNDTPANLQTRVRGETKAQMARAATIPKGINAMIRSYRVMRSRSWGAFVRSIQPAKRTHTAVATVIMLRL